MAWMADHGIARAKNGKKIVYGPQLSITELTNITWVLIFANLESLSLPVGKPGSPCNKNTEQLLSEDRPIIGPFMNLKLAISNFLTIFLTLPYSC